MFSELIDTLRCPAAHEDSWLVASSWETVGRRIVRGELGCPVCGATFPIVEGIAQFGGPPRLTSEPSRDTDAAMRLAAQLHLVEAAAPHALLGATSRHAAALLEALPHAVVLVGDPACETPVDPRVSAVTLPPGALPVAAGSLRGAALDAAHATPAWLAAAARAIARGGRLVAPAGTELDGGEWQLIASDETAAVAERVATSSAPIALRRAPTRPLFSAE